MAIPVKNTLKVEVILIARKMSSSSAVYKTINSKIIYITREHNYHGRTISENEVKCTCL